MFYEKKLSGLVQLDCNDNILFTKSFINFTYVYFIHVNYLHAADICKLRFIVF